MSEKNEAKLRRERWLKQSEGPSRIHRERVAMARTSDEEIARVRREKQAKGAKE
jgi:hypothetical protein